MHCHLSACLSRKNAPFLNCSLFVFLFVKNCKMNPFFLFFFFFICIQCKFDTHNTLLVASNDQFLFPKKIDRKDRLHSHTAHFIYLQFKLVFGSIDSEPCVQLFHFRNFCQIPVYLATGLELQDQLIVYLYCFFHFFF